MGMGGTGMAACGRLGCTRWWSAWRPAWEVGGLRGLRLPLLLLLLLLLCFAFQVFSVLCNEKVSSRGTQLLSLLAPHSRIFTQP